VSESNNLNFNGGSANSTEGLSIPGGSAGFALDPMQGTTGSQTFSTTYTNIALTKATLPRIDATFRDFNDQPEIRFIKESFNVVQKSDVLDYINVSDFFHPLQSFSDFQKQTFVIGPRNSINLDPSGFEGTSGESSMLIARAYYLPETEEDEKILFWDYKGMSRNVMGQFMILTGAIKEDTHWKGWDLDPFSTYGHTGGANSSQGGFIFTNPTDKNVKLTILTAN
jgi:hypothetical protein